MFEKKKNHEPGRRVPSDEQGICPGDSPETEPASLPEDIDQPEVGKVETEADILRASLAEMTENWQRERASFQNYRRRVEEEKKEVRKFACCDFASELIRVVDYFESSVSFAEILPKEAESVVIGVKYTLAELIRVLATNGVEQIEACEGQPFDTAVMQAVERKETDEAASGTVLCVQRKGWRCYDRVLRPAQVVVAAEKESKLPEKGGEDG
jgi:molecular chaperone GrpE